MYTNWDSGQPNNNNNQDYLQIYTSGYWDDTDGGSDNKRRYITEWGRAGAEFTAEFADLNASDTASGTANGHKNGVAPKMTINFDWVVPDDYVDIRNGTPLIDIPITFGGTAIFDTDYTVSVSGGRSEWRDDGRLYVRNTNSVVLTFNFNDNSDWKFPRTITAALHPDGSENIYAIGGNATSQVWLFDDKPQLSLGQGANQFIHTAYTFTPNDTLPKDNNDFNTNNTVLVFDNDGINESDASFAAQGLYDYFAIRWETYLRIPETGNYVFRTTTDDGTELTIQRNNSSGEVLDSFSHWEPTSATSHDTKPISLKEGDVVWLRLDYFENTGAASAKLTWDRPNGSGGTVSNEIVPASAMFLSESLAKGLNRTESDTDSTSLGFQLFANKSTTDEVNVQLTSSSETANSTFNTTQAQRQTDGTRVGGDYAIVANSAILGTDNIGINGVVQGRTISPFGTSANAATTSRDSSTEVSPVGGVPLRMSVTGNDPHLATYNSSQWNVADAQQGDTWTLSVYAKADRSTSGQLFIFEANENGVITKAPATTIQLGNEWQRHSFTYTFTDPSARYIQVRLDGPDSGGTGASIWWDGLQVEQASQASHFSVSSEINHFAAKFNPLDLHSGGFGTLPWTPSSDNVNTLPIVKSFDVLVLPDSYAENTESITLTLGSGTGYGVSNNSQTITIADNPFVLSLKAGQNPTEAGANEADLGWFTISANKPAPNGGLRVRYEITGGSATRDVDYYAPQATLSTADFDPENLVVLPTGATEARIYISAIADAIREGDETITLKLIPNVETDDKGFTFQRYNIDSGHSEATLTIIDSTAYTPAVVVTPADRTGLATVRAQLINGQQQAAFEVRITSQPLAEVTVNLSSSSGTLSSQQLTFTSSNWTQPQRVTLSDLRTDGVSTVSLGTASSDSFYSALSATQRVIPSNWPSELELTLWEGGSPVPMQPAASVQAVDGTEGSNSRLGFELNLASPVTGSPVELLYELQGGTSSPFGTVANAAITSRDTGTAASPVGGVPLRMTVTGNDPYLETYNGSQWNIAEAIQGDTWTVSVYAKADRPTSGQLFIFEVDESGRNTKAPAKTIQLSTDWQRQSFTYTLTDPSTRYIQVRLDGPQDDGSGTEIWWDGLQVEKGDQASPFTTSPDTNQFAGTFNSLDLYSGYGLILDGKDADVLHQPQATYRPLILSNNSSGGEFAYAELGELTTVSSSGEISAEAWVRRDAASTDAGVLDFTDDSGHNQITLGFHDTTGKPKLDIRDPGGALLLSLICDSEVGLGEWNHLAYSVNARGVASLYLNGDLAKRGQLTHASGLKVSLYEGKNFETLRSSSGESTIDFDDSYDTTRGGDGDTFSIRATGQIQARTNGDNSFAVLSDEGVRIWINGQQVVNSWTNHEATWNSFTVPNLVAGEWYDIQIDYYEDGGAARLLLADHEGGMPTTALRHVPLFNTARSHNSIGRTALGSSASGYFNGAIRGVGIWNAARSQEQIQASKLAALPGGTGLISALALNNSTENSVAGAPAAVLHSGSSNSATFATTPIYGIKIAVGSSSISLPTPAVDDLTAEGTESLTLTLIDSGRYSIAGSTGTATAYLSDNDIADVLFLSASQAGSTDGTTTWTPTSQFRVSESDVSNGTITPLGIRLNSRPTAAVTLTLDLISYDSGEIQVTNPANPAATAVQLVFTPDNWDQIQPLQLQGIDDDENDDDTTQQLSFTVSSSDPIYAAIRPSLSVLVIDNDATTANESLATAQSSTAPMVSLTGPTQPTIREDGSDSATFTISLPNAASEDTLVFFELDRRLSQVSASDIMISAGSGNQSMGGLTRFDSASGAEETAKLDSDGINETAASFNDNNLTGAFTSTWSGYIFIPETGSYNFNIPVQGGTRLTLDGQVVIDKLNTNALATWGTGTIQLNRGDFLAIKLDYQSFNTDSPSVALQWKRPTDGGTDYREEIVPSDFLTRTSGFSLLIPKGSTTGSFTMTGVQDQVAEGIETLATSLLTARGVGLIVLDQSGINQLQVTLATTDRESINLPEGTVLALGEDLGSNGEKSETIATFTVNASATIHRDRTTALTGTLTWTATGETSAYNSSVVGLVAGYGSDLYQIADPSVSLTLTAPLIANGSNSYLASLQLESTNRSTVTIPSGTTLNYTVDSTGEFISLVLSDSLTVASGETVTDVAFSESAKSNSLDPTAASTPLVGLSSSYVLPNSNVLQLIDDDQAGLFFSLDATGNTTIDSTPFNLSEGGSSTTRYVRLTSQPTASVTVYVETDDASEVLLQVPGTNPAPADSRIALTFKPSNWQTAQAFTVIPVDDKLVDGNNEVNLHVRTTSSDSFYNINEANLPKLPFRVNDNDSATLLVELQQSTISKAGNGFLNLSLTAQPTADVTVSLVPSDSQFIINNRSIGRGETLIFTPTNWSTIQTISLWAVDDTTVEDITRSQLKLSTSTSDVSFNGLSINPVQIDIVDNDLPQALITLISDSSEDAKPGRFRIELTNPAPNSAGSTGIQVSYGISALSLDPGLGYPPTPSSINKITQSPGSTSGQVRIAPGHSSSDVIVVPIDDFVADTVNKTFTVQLTAGEGYSLSNDAVSNSATVQIINNDVAGVVLFTSGERVLVKETGESATYQLALLSQPTDNVTVKLSELIPSGASRQLGTISEAYEKTYTFTPSNWYTPQQISVWAYDDAKIEDGTGDNQFTGIHAAQLSYNFSSNDSAYNSASHSTDSSHFTNMVQAVDVLDFELPAETADALQSSLTSLQEGVDSLSLPIVGSLDGKAGDGLRKFITNLANSIRQIGTPTPSKLSKLLSKEIADALGIPESAVTVSLAMQGTSAVVVSFQFSDSYDIFSVPLAADFGLPGLGFQSEGTLDAYFSYDAGLELIFPRSGDIYLNTNNDPDEGRKTFLNAEFNTSLSPDFNLTGGLGFLQLDAVNQPSANDNVKINNQPASTELDVSFALDLSGDAGSDGMLTLSELMSSSLDLENVFQYELQGAAAMSFGVTTSVNGSAAIPSFSFDLASLLPLFDYSNKEQTEAEENQTSFYFDNIKLDLGTYITQMLGPIVDGLDSILNPLYPIVDALYSDTHIFATIGIEKTFDADKDGKVSTLDLASWFADFYATFDPIRGAELKDTIDTTIEFLGVIKGVMDLIRDLEQMKEEGSFYIDYGSYVLPAFSAGDQSASTESVVVDEDSTPELSSNTGEQADAGGSDSSGTSSSSFKDIMEQLDELGFEIPLIDDPKNAIKLLLGQDVSLFEWRMPGMGMTSEIEESFPIYPGIEGIIEGGFGVDATIGFGFDTFGLNEWKQSGFKAGDAWKVFNGFYVADWLDGDDVPEFTMDATMGAGLGLTALVVRSDITGGLEAAVSFDLLDEGEIAGTSDGKIRGSEITNRISNPLDLFELVGSLSAYLKSKVQVGIDMGFYSIWDTVWQEKLAEIPLFEFGIGGSYGSGTVSNGYLKGTTVFFDGNGNLTIDPYEPSTTSSDDAHYHLRIDHRTFDTNRNGTIDLSEGRLIAFGGIDSTTGLPLQVPFLAPLGQMLTPLTTLHTLAIESGLNDDEASNWIDQAFGLRGFDYLREDPVLRLNQAAGATATASEWDAMAAYIGHIKLHFGWDVLAYSLQQLLSDQYPEDIETEIGLITAFTQELLELATDTPINDRLATAALRTISRHQPDMPADVAILAPLAAEMAANANWEFSKQIDTVLASAQASTISLPETYATIHRLKRDAFTHYRAETDTISHELYLINDPAQLRRTVHERLQQVHHGFVTEQFSSEADQLIDGLTSGWSLEQGSALVSPTTFSARNALQALGVNLGAQQLAFTLNANPNQSGLSPQVRLLANLEGLGLDQRKAGHAFTYLVDTDLTPSSFLYDGNSRTGARLFNLGEGQPLVAELNYIDNDRGDRDLREGVIQDPSTFGELIQDHQFTVSTESPILTVAANTTNPLPAAVFATSRMVRSGATSNQVGYIVLASGEDWDPGRITVESIRERLQILGGTLENSNTPSLGSNTSLSRELQFTTGDKLVFLELSDLTIWDLDDHSTTLDQLSNRIGTMQISISSAGAIATLNSQRSGLSIQLALQEEEASLAGFVARQQHQAAVLDFTGLGNAQVAGVLELAREASYNSRMNFYRVLDVKGAVADPITGDPIRPGQPGYEDAARASQVSDLSGLFTSNNITTSRTITVSDSFMLAPFADVDTGKERHTFFAFKEANTDGVQHFQVLGDNVFGLEDLYGGGDRDFDDLIFSFKPTALIGSSPLA
ncbi:MAG: hypothetical protein KFB97_16250 [Cyanobium sp. M30B3]|nr:MAG: hypothetical protein KFB97_16250 [Cyanobium sp. M30B3]